MSPIATTAAAASDAFQSIAETTPGDRGRRAGAGALVLRAVAARLAGVAGAEFLGARAARELDRLPRGPERAILRRLLEAAAGTDGVPHVLADLLVAYAGELERTGRLDEAAAAVALARTASPADPEVALHAGRVARRRGDAAGARSAYAAVRELDAPCGRFTRLAAVGEALLSSDPAGALGRAIRAAVRVRDGEAAAVGLEERAGVRRAAGDHAGAARDFLAAGVRFTDPVDRGRVALALADLAVAAGDAGATRDALRAALDEGDAMQRAIARARLHALARAQGDEVGARRWRSSGRPSLASLGLYRAGAGTSALAPVLARWRDRVERRRARES